jgi:hypothetical protein
MLAASSGITYDSTFQQCYRLRSIGGFSDNTPDTVAGVSIYGMYNVFCDCYSLDELVNLPFVYGTYNANYSFRGLVDYTHRLKELTFRDGIVLASGSKGGIIDLTYYTGYANRNLANYGMSMDKKVIDDATYAALKNDPDWWTQDINYSRYNHDSAVNTINSLPDVSVISTTHTIKFKGAAGAKTDGGAINTLTEAEIAVATAKGWTVTLA